MENSILKSQISKYHNINDTTKKEICNNIIGVIKTYYKENNICVYNGIVNIQFVMNDFDIKYIKMNELDELEIRIDDVLDYTIYYNTDISIELGIVILELLLQDIENY